MVDINIRQNETSYGNVLYIPDLVWNNQNGSADFKIGKDGGLQNLKALETAVIIQLFTDLRAEESDNLSATDPMGWAGDCFDSETFFPLGSNLWLLKNSAFTDRNIDKMQRYVEAALQPLKEQTVISAYEVILTPLKNIGVVAIEINLYSKYSKEKYNIKFELVWSQLYGD
jgi:phage gp46-like protein